MTTEHPDDSRRRRSQRGRKRLFIGAGVGAVLLLLVVNLVMSLPGLLSGETPDGFLAKLGDQEFVTTERAQHVGLWLALLPAVVGAILGVRWSHEAFLRSERPAFMWLRRAFALSLVTWGVLIVVIMDAEVFSRTALAIAAGAIFSVNLIPFALAARAAADSRFGGRGPSDGNEHRRRRSRSSSEHPEEAEA